MKTKKQIGLRVDEDIICKIKKKSHPSEKYTDTIRRVLYNYANSSEDEKIVKERIIEEMSK